MKSIKSKQLICALLLFSLSSCTSKHTNSCPPIELKMISIVDRNGLTETISQSDRIKQYYSVDFLQNQPYEKVLRVYNRDEKGDVPAFLTSYHPNGQPKQYLEIVNSRALGIYKEWHANGCLKLETCVVGGEADLSVAAEKTWLFNGMATAWDEDGCLAAEINYVKGSLEGESLYYHPNGKIWKKIRYDNNLMNGLSEVYKDNGELLSTILYENGVRNGLSERFWNRSLISTREIFQNNLLIEGDYLNSKGEIICEIRQGNGYRAIFGRNEMVEQHEYRNGILEGEIKVFASDGKIARKYSVKNNMKHGEEVEYYEAPHLRHLPKLSLAWFEDKVQGVSKTWYDNGIQESKREFSNNQKNGVSTAWFRDGKLMLIEIYEQDKLLKGEYFRRGDDIPISQVIDGEGTATMFDAEGNFLQKIFYDQGVPIGAS